MKLLVVVDMQYDFISGVLGTQEAQEIVAKVVDKVTAAVAQGDTVVFTQDTHTPDYLNTQEGRKLPLAHCVKGTAGWEIVAPLAEYAKGRTCFEKPTFGSTELAHWATRQDVDQIELVGLCTDICVISNAMLLKAALPEVPVAVDSACCAGVTPQSHQTALDAMKACQIAIS